jgi:hypothetical protein
MDASLREMVPKTFHFFPEELLIAFCCIPDSAPCVQNTHSVLECRFSIPDMFLEFMDGRKSKRNEFDGLLVGIEPSPLD